MLLFALVYLAVDVHIVLRTFFFYGVIVKRQGLTLF